MAGDTCDVCKTGKSIGVACTSEVGLHPIPVPADWNKYGKKAGHLRNGLMLAYRPKIVIGFHDQYWLSKGTVNMRRQATQQSIPFYLVTETWLERKRNADLLSQCATSGLEGMVALMMHLRSKRQGELEQIE